MNFQSGIPIYTQVIGALQEQMITGSLRPGDKLPSSRELAKEFTINPNTASRVYSEMDTMGLTFTRRGIGTFVTEDESVLAAMREDYTRGLIEDFVKKMQRIGCKAEELPELLQHYVDHTGSHTAEDSMQE